MIKIIKIITIIIGKCKSKTNMGDRHAQHSCFFDFRIILGCHGFDFFFFFCIIITYEH